MCCIPMYLVVVVSACFAGASRRHFAATSGEYRPSGLQYEHHFQKLGVGFDLERVGAKTRSPLKALAHLLKLHVPSAGWQVIRNSCSSPRRPAGRKRLPAVQLSTQDDSSRSKVDKRDGMSWQGDRRAAIWTSVGSVLLATTGSEARASENLLKDISDGFWDPIVNPIIKATLTEEEKEQIAKEKERKNMTGQYSMSREEIEVALNKVLVAAIVNADDEPLFEGFLSSKVSYFYLDPEDAKEAYKNVDQKKYRIKVVTLPEVYFDLVRGDPKNFGGELKLRTTKKQCVMSNQIAAGESFLRPEQGRIPLFFSDKVTFNINGESILPFFFDYDDLNEVFVTASKEKGMKVKKIPDDVIKVVLLDDYVDQMKQGILNFKLANVERSTKAAFGFEKLVKAQSE